jgi:hypothetical protein
MVSVCLSVLQGRGRAGRLDIFSYAEKNGFLAAIRIWEFRSPPPPPRYCCADSWWDLFVTNFYRKKQMQKRRFLLYAWVPNIRIVNETFGRTFKQACFLAMDSWRDLSVTNFYRKKQMQKRRFLLCAWVPNRRIVNETSGRTFKQACFLADGSNWWRCNYVIVKRIAKSNFWQNPEESKRFRWCVRSED